MKTYTATAYNTTGNKPAEWLFTTSQDLPFLTANFLKWCVDLAIGNIDIDHSDIKINVTRGDSDQNVVMIFLRSWQFGSSVYCNVYYEYYYNGYYKGYLVRTITLAE